MIGPTTCYGGKVFYEMFVHDRLAPPAGHTLYTITLSLTTIQHVAAVAVVTYDTAGDNSGGGAFNCGVRRKSDYGLRGRTAAVTLPTVALPHVGFWHVFHLIISYRLLRITGIRLFLTVGYGFPWNGADGVVGSGFREAMPAATTVVPTTGMSYTVVPTTGMSTAACNRRVQGFNSVFTAHNRIKLSLVGGDRQGGDSVRHEPGGRAPRPVGCGHPGLVVQASKACQRPGRRSVHEGMLGSRRQTGGDSWTGRCAFPPPDGPRTAHRGGEMDRGLRLAPVERVEMPLYVTVFTAT